jgi:sulfotransferase 6B1
MTTSDVRADGPDRGQESGQPLVPPVFLNSVPKSGTHLVKQILSGFPGLRHREGDEFYEGYPNQIEAHRQRLGSPGAGRLASGHVYYSETWHRMLDEFGYRRLFLYRDPRDVVVSLMHFYTYRLPDHPGYVHLSRCLHTNRDRLRALIIGFEHDGLGIPGIDQWCRRFLNWRHDPGALCLTFEELLRSKESQRASIRSIVRYLGTKPLPVECEEDVIDAMQAGINPATSFTFRRGEIGSWREEFDAETTIIFKALAGDLLIELGYEADHEW